MKPLVSILIPAYNVQEWIAETVRSAIGQAWSHKEIIIVDDGSTDKTLAIAREFASSQVKVVTQPNQGASAARNHAYSLCQGDYIQWLDADDLLAPDKISRQMAISAECQSNRTLLSCARGQFIFRVNRAVFNPTALWCDLTPVEWLIRKMGQNVFMQTGCWLVSRELCDAAGPWDTRLRYDDDGEYFCRVILACDGIRFVPEAKVFYRITPSSRLSYIGSSDSKKNDLLLSMQLHVAYLRSLEESERVRTACLKFLDDSLINFFPERPDIVQELEKLAESLGGRLSVPRLRRKYAWLRPFLGWRLAKQVQNVLPEIKASAATSWDYGMYKWANWRRGDGRKSSAESRFETTN
jgi:glycosyltransferase involved in cell wall biosynthesis